MFQFNYQNKTIVANWKMNPNSCIEAINLVGSYINNIKNNNINIIVAPPSVYLSGIYAKLLETSKNNIFLGAQNICWERKGAFTGEISADSFKDLGCDFVIIGHSERRIYNGETEQLLKQKCLVAVKSGLVPIFCIGETKEEYNDKKTWQVLEHQLAAIKGLAAIGVNSDILVAYEPVWAISTGVSADLTYINQVCGYIREKINLLVTSKFTNNKNVKILYGGSVNLKNAKEIFQLPNLEGALVGGASLNATEFASICELV